MITLCILALLVLILFAGLLLLTGLVVLWPVTLALGLMIIGDILIIRALRKK